jgi:hypothetical protein
MGAGMLGGVNKACVEVAMNKATVIKRVGIDLIIVNEKKRMTNAFLFLFCYTTHSHLYASPLILKTLYFV